MVADLPQLFLVQGLPGLVDVLVQTCPVSTVAGLSAILLLKPLGPPCPVRLCFF
jgi:hypothetical protein